MERGSCDRIRPRVTRPCDRRDPLVNIANGEPPRKRAGRSPLGHAWLYPSAPAPSRRILRCSYRSCVSIPGAMIDAPPRPSTASGSVPAPPSRAATPRLTSLDVFRGVTMLFMASEILHIPSVARQFPDSGFARFLADMLDHRAWVGCVPWDLIQPAFMFMVGVSLPYSIASRRAKGQSFARMLAHSVLPGADPHRAWHLSAFAVAGPDLLHVRRRAHPDRARLCVPLPARLDAGPHAARGRRAHPRRLLGCLRALSAAAAGIRYDDGRRPGRLAAPRHRLRGALGQEHEPRRPRRSMVPQPLSAASGHSSTTAAAT